MQSLNTLTREQLVGEVETLRKRVDEHKQLEARSRQTQERLDLVAQLLELLNRPQEKTSAIRGILLLVKEFAGFEAVGVRLRDGEDFPYYETSGFPTSFVKAETSLCALGPDGEPLRDATGRVILECMCGNVISGRTDPSLSFFTKGGSFWTNSTTKLLATTTEEDRQAHTRNRCNTQGYESVALVPLHAKGETIGLLQLNDSREDMFTLDMIEFFEEIGNFIVIAFARGRMEEMLEKSEAFLNATGEMAKVGGWELDALTKEVRCTEQIYRIHEVPLDYTPPLDEVINFFHPEDRPKLVRAIQRALEHGEPYDMEIRVITATGNHLWTRTICKPEIVDGKTVKLAGTFQDITERKKAEIALRESEMQYRSLFENPTIGIGISDESGKVLAANETMCKVTGYPEDKIVGLGLKQRYVNSGDREIVLDMLQRHGSVANLEVRLYNKDRKEYCANLSIARIRFGGRDAWLTTALDVTERRRAEASLRRAFDEIKELRDRLRVENICLRDEINRVTVSRNIIGDSAPLRAVVRQIGLVAPTDSTVLILGESGTGKELVAREIHTRSKRKDRQLVIVNCASIPTELYESEFFGHVKGAFTGAVKDRVGRFELADGGTLFLDEVAEIPIELQGKLLRVLQEGEYERVGDDKTRRVDARIIAATNHDLKREVENGRFRGDLYFRLNVFPIDVAPLRNRKQDIPLLASRFLTIISKRLGRPAIRLTQANILALQDYDWPGNVRELQNVIERAIITSRRGVLWFDLSGGSPKAAETASADTTVGTDDRDVITETEMGRRERENVVAALIKTDWRIFGPDGAAALLGVKPTTLASRIKRMGISKPGST